MSSHVPNLTEDEIDDLLYFARTSDTEEFTNLSKELCEREKVELGELLEACKDGESGNNVVHMVGGNGGIDFLNTLLPKISPTLAPPESPLLQKIINARNAAGNTPLHYAAVNGHLEVVKALMDAGADPLVMNNVGRDAIFEAEMAGKNEVVEWVLREGGEGVESGVGGQGDGDGEGEDVEIEGGGEVNEGEGGEGGEIVDAEGLGKRIGDICLGEGKGKGKEEV